MKFQLSIRNALYITTAIAFYSAILGLAYQGEPWGRGITFAVTCSIGIWLFSAIAYWALVGLMGMIGVTEPGSPKKSSAVPANTPLSSSPNTDDSASLDLMAGHTPSSDHSSTENPL